MSRCRCHGRCGGGSSWDKLGVQGNLVSHPLHPAVGLEALSISCAGLIQEAMRQVSSCPQAAVTMERGLHQGLCQDGEETAPAPATDLTVLGAAAGRGLHPGQGLHPRSVGLSVPPCRAPQ